MKILKRILVFAVIFFLYIVLKEFLVLYQAAKALHSWAGYGLLIILGGFLIYFVGVPAFQILRMPKLRTPTRNPDQIPQCYSWRMKRFGKNHFLKRNHLETQNLSATKESYQKIIQFLEPEAQHIRKKYVTQVFYTTSIAQNGFLDAVLILSASVNLVKDLFLLYHGRVSNRDLFRIGRLVVLSMAIGGSEGIEYVTDEILSKVFAGSVKGIPFASKILGSIADGFINAALLTRISLITESYCTMIFIESESALYPSHKTILSTTQILTSDLIDRISKEMKKLTRDKASQVVIATVNPVGYVMSKALDKYSEGDQHSPQKREWMKEISTLMHNPVSYVIRKGSEIFRKRDEID